METNNDVYRINLFQEGKIATGESFIGRKKIIFEELMNPFCECNGSVSRSIVGLNRIGKTSLVSQFTYLVKEKYPDTICVRVILGQRKWPSLIQAIMQEILIHKTENEMLEYIYETCQEGCNIKLDHDLAENSVELKFQSVLEYMQKINQKFILIIDEFDTARFAWKNESRYFESLRDCAQNYKFFCIIVSRRPLKIIEMDSYGQSCFYNVFPEINIGSFNKDDMTGYYDLLKEKYHIDINKDERIILEQYTGFCPHFLIAVGNKLASAAIHYKTQPSIEEICSEKNFKNNRISHYEEFLKRMQEDGLWDDVVRILMGISPTLIEDVGRNTFDESRIQIMEVKGYLREQNGQYVVFSDDFTAWAQNSLFRSEIDTIYSTIIRAEVAIREMLRKEMPVIWNKKYNQNNWEDDFINNINVPQSVDFFTKIQQNGNSIIRTYLRKAIRYNLTATPVDAMTMNVKLSLIKEYWNDGIGIRFNSESYSEWENCFESLGEIRNYVFHPVISIDDVSNDNYHLLKNVNDSASRIINQLFK